MNNEIPTELLLMAVQLIEQRHQAVPFHLRGIKISQQLIQVTMKILNEEQSKALPQNCSQQLREKSYDGLDRRIKERRDLDLRTANIISDVLQDAGIVEVYQDRNPRTGRLVKFTKLDPKWIW